jgi:hypothetical protein
MVLHRVVIESEPQLESSALVPPVTTASSRSSYVLPMDYEILGKCTYVRKSTDRVNDTYRYLTKVTVFVPVI